MNVACDYEAPMQMLTTEKYIASRGPVEWQEGVSGSSMDTQKTP